MIEKTITHIPDNLCLPFVMWMILGGHEVELKKNFMHLRKGKSWAKIYCRKGVIQASYEMNDYCIERFKLFCMQWLKKGKDFIDSLNFEANMRLSFGFGEVA